MRTLPYCLVGLAMLVYQALPAQGDLTNDWLTLSPSLRCRAIGNGQSTGEIGTIQIRNDGSEAVPIQAQTFFIPSDGKHQGYLARIPAGMSAAPETETVVPIIGYCTDLDKPTVPTTYPLSSPKDWYPVQQTMPVAAPEGVKIISSRTTLAPFAEALIEDITTSTAYRRNRKKSNWQLQYPGTSQPINGSLRLNQAPAVSAPLLLKVTELLEQRYEDLAKQRLIRTPLSGDKLRERETIIQHTLWIWTAQIRGQPYTYSDFTELVKQALAQRDATTISQLSAQQASAAKTLWSTFHRLIYQAQLSSQLPEEVAQFPTLIDLPDWSSLSLTSAYRKPGLLLARGETAPLAKKRPLWLPIGGGIILGGGVAYLFLDENPITVIDTIIIPPPPPPPPPLDSLVVVDDEYTVSCQPPATIFPLQNDQGARIRIRSIGSTGEVVVEQFGDDALIISDFGEQDDFSFLINIEDSLGNTASSLVRVLVDLPEIAALNDSLTTPYLTPFSGNLLSNDTGESLSILSSAPTPTGLTLTLAPNGTLSGTPLPGFTGQVNFDYIIQDGCRQRDTATVTIIVGEPDCNFSTTFSTSPADCGFSNGSIEATISPENDYSLLWSTNDTTTNLTNLSAGEYNLTVTSNAGLCEATFSTAVEQQPIAYLIDQSSTPGNCAGGGDIIVELSSPEDEQLVLDWNGPAGSNSLIVNPGTSNLGQLTNLIPGDYSFVIYPQSTGPDCADSTMISIADTTLSLQANADNFLTPYETSMTGNLLLNDLGQNISLTANTTPTSGTVAVEANGLFTFTPASDFAGQASFTYTITDLCGSTDLAQVTITVSEPDCDITISLTATDSDCGLDNGSISSSVSPENTYTYAWSSGAEGSGLENLSPGVYSLSVTSEGGLCQTNANIEIAERPIQYLISSSVTAGTCTGGGNISLALQSPEDLPLTLVVSGGGNNTTFEVMPGTVELSSLLNLPAGNYTISIYPTVAGNTCAQNFAYNVPDDSPDLIVQGENYSVDYQTPVNDNLLNNDNGLNLVVNSVENTVGGVVNFEPDGTFIYVPFNDFTGTGGFSYTIVDACGNTEMGTVTVEVGGPECVFNIEFVNTAASCGLADGNIMTMAIPEDAYTFLWSTGATSPGINQLAAGEYQLTVTTENGLCTQIYSTLVSEILPDYIVDSSTDPADCTGGGNIRLTLSAPDGSDFGGVLAGPGINQTLSLNSGTNNLNESFNLLPGDYSITIYSLTAGFQCSQNIELSIADSTPAIFTTNDNFITEFETPVSGNFLTNDGGLDIGVTSVSTVNNGTLMHQDDGSFTFTPLPGFAGITGFTYTIMDACGQTANAEVIINVRPPACVFTVDLEVANAVCDLPNGMISTVVNPPGDYTYAWSNGATTSDIDGLAVGSYNVSVTGNNGFCVIQAAASITNGPPLFVDSLRTAPGDCAGNGSIIVEAYAPGNGTLDVIVNGPNGSEIITIPSGFSNLGELVNLPSGVYDLVFFPTAVGLSCNETTFAVVEDNSPPMIVNDDAYFTPFQSPVVNNVLLNDEGLLLEVVGTDNVIGGTVEMSSNGDFVFTPDNGATQAASFTYSATDACNELQVGVVNIEIGPSTCNFSLQLSSVNASCGATDGQLTAFVSPAGNYSYEWSTGSTDTLIGDLAAGTYSVTVIDNTDDCPLSLRDTILENSAGYLSNLEVEPANCNGGAIVEFVLSGHVAGLYTIAVAQPNGMIEVLDNVPSGLVQLQNLLTIEPGTYNISVYNQNVGESCIDTLDALVPAPLPDPVIALNSIVSPSTPGTMDGSFEVVFTTLSNGPYSIIINGQEVGQTDGSPFLWDNLPEGTYSVFATDSNGCASNTATVTLTSTTTINLGWSSSGWWLGNVSPEGLLQQWRSRDIPFVQVTFRSKRSHQYRLRLQELRRTGNLRGPQQALLLDFQLVQQPALLNRNGNHGGQWGLANGFSWLRQTQGELFWHSTLSWQPENVSHLDLVLDTYLGKQYNIQLGLQYLW